MPVDGRRHDGNMKIALLGDVHCLWPALRAVLEDARRWGAELILNAGDSFGLGGFPNETLKALFASDVRSIIGNWEASLLRRGELAETVREKFSNPATQEALLKVWERAGPEGQAAWRQFAELTPSRWRYRVNGYRLWLCHHTDVARVDKEAPWAKLVEAAERHRAQIFVVGHTHEPLIRHHNGICVINVGFVGRLRHWEPFADYVRLEVAPTPHARLRRVRYDIGEVLERLEELEMPKEFLHRVLHPRTGYRKKVKKKGKKRKR